MPTEMQSRHPAFRRTAPSRSRLGWPLRATRVSKCRIMDMERAAFRSRALQTYNFLWHEKGYPFQRFDAVRHGASAQVQLAINLEQARLAEGCDNWFLYLFQVLNYSIFHASRIQGQVGQWPANPTN